VFGDIADTSSWHGDSAAREAIHALEGGVGNGRAA
jgi:hypothetical protein